MMCRLLVCLVLLVAVVGVADCAHADSIEISNLGSARTLKLSDLIVYGAGGKKEVLLKPATEPMGADDDIDLPWLSSAIFDVDFRITKYVVSQTIAGSETETSAFKIVRLVPKKLSSLFDDGTDSPLVLSVDDSIDTDTVPAEGSLISFTNGLNVAHPGWFVGTGIDFDTGDVLNPFTGTARVESNSITAAVIPEPATVFLMALGFGVAGLARRRRR